MSLNLLNFTLGGSTKSLDAIEDELVPHSVEVEGLRVRIEELNVRSEWTPRLLNALRDLHAAQIQFAEAHLLVAKILSERPTLCDSRPLETALVSDSRREEKERQFQESEFDRVSLSSSAGPSSPTIGGGEPLSLGASLPVTVPLAGDPSSAPEATLADLHRLLNQQGQNGAAQLPLPSSSSAPISRTGSRDRPAVAPLLLPRPLTAEEEAVEELQQLLFKFHTLQFETNLDLSEKLEFTLISALAQLKEKENFDAATKIQEYEMTRRGLALSLSELLQRQKKAGKKEIQRRLEEVHADQDKFNENGRGCLEFLQSLDKERVESMGQSCAALLDILGNSAAKLANEFPPGIGSLVLKNSLQHAQHAD